jgi:hypothetical protein
LSAAGFYFNLIEILTFLFLTWWEGLLLLVTSVYAWIAYFAMGFAWIGRQPISRVWPTTGTLAALLALNGGGSAFTLGKAYSPSIVLLHAAFVMPAVLMAAWMTITQTR